MVPQRVADEAYHRYHRTLWNDEVKRLQLQLNLKGGSYSKADILRLVKQVRRHRRALLWCPVRARGPPRAPR